MAKQVTKIIDGDPRYEAGTDAFQMSETVEIVETKLLTIQQIDSQLVAVETARTRANTRFDRKRDHLNDQRTLLVAANTP